MPWFRFTSKYDHLHGGSHRQQTSFPAGYEGFVKKEVAEGAKAAGAGEEIERPTTADKADEES